MRTSSLQFQLLVEFMKRNGDLSKPVGGPQGKASNIKSWFDITEILNADVYGDRKTVDKWRKVWSDLKNNTKRKAALIYRATGSAGNCTVPKLRLSVLEQQILKIITPQTATGMAEVLGMGLVQDEQEWNESRQPSINESAWEVPIALSSSIENKSGSSRGSTLPTCTFSVENPIRDESLSSPFVNCSVAPEALRDSGTSTRSSPGHLYHHLLKNETSPAHDRRTQTQPELSKQAFVTDSECRFFQWKQHNENVRLREREHQQQQQWLHIFTQFVGLGNRFLNYLEKK